MVGWRGIRQKALVLVAVFVALSTLGMLAGTASAGSAQPTAVGTSPASPPSAAADLTAPTLTSVNYVATGISLSFTAPTVSAGSTISSYDYQISTDGGATVAFVGNTSTTASPFIDPNGPSYCEPPVACC